MKQITTTGILACLMAVTSLHAQDFEWAKSFGGTTFADRGTSISIDASGNVYTTGYYQGTVDFDPGAGTSNLTSAGSNDVFVQKLDSSGNYLWAKSFGGSLGDIGNSITVDASGNAYTTGTFDGTVDFDPGAGTSNLTSAGSGDIFVQKLDSSGNFVWAKSFGGTSSDVGSSISTDASGNVYTTGYYEGIADFDPGAGTSNLTSAGSDDIFVQKMDSSGNFVWAKSFGGTTFDIGTSISIDASGNVYTTGSFQDTVDFDPGSGTSNLSSAGSEDVFVQKMSQCIPTAGIDTITACDSLVWIDGVTYTASNNTATHTLTNAAGCDSVVTLDLTMNFSNTATDVITACDSLVWIDGITYTASNNTATHTLTNAAGCDSVVTLDLTINTVSDISTSTSGLTITANNASAAYQWLDCNSNNAVIAGETGQTFTATANGNYAVELTENGCVDTSACVVILSVGIIENTFSQSIRVFPNPTTGDFSIDLGENLKAINIRITDINGKVVKSIENYNSQILNLTIEEPTGFYLLNIESEERKAIIRLIKQ